VAAVPSGLKSHPTEYNKIILIIIIPVSGRRGAQGCETSRLPHFLDNRLTDGREIMSLTLRPPFTPKEDSWYSISIRG
jgi:hypothetical protein